MNDLMTLGRAFNMEKILLTVFKGLYPSFLGRIASGYRTEWNFIVNTSAMQFYKHIGCVVIVCWCETYLNLFIYNIIDSTSILLHRIIWKKTRKRSWISIAKVTQTMKFFQVSYNNFDYFGKDIITYIVIPENT